MGLDTIAETANELGPALRVLGNRRRLEVLQALDSGAADAGAIAEALGLARRTVDGHLGVLHSLGLVNVQLSPDNGRVYALNRQKAALLNAAFLSLMGRIGSNGAGGLARAGAPADDLALTPAEAPEACARCHNAAFVRDMLDELDRSLVKARQYQDRLTEMAAQVVGAQEDERKRIARELHDETAQALASVLIRISLLERSLESGTLRAQLGELRDITEAALRGVRRLATDLRPPMLDDLGLEKALRAHVRDWSPRWSTEVTLTGRHLGRLPGDVELVLFRVVQEALSNVAKHARASRAEVSMSRRGRTLRLTVEDDGRGFDVEAARDSRLGLFGMQERLALVGGTLAIHSAPGRGTRVCAEVPLPRSRGVR